MKKTNYTYLDWKQDMWQSNCYAECGCPEDIVKINYWNYLKCVVYFKWVHFMCEKFGHKWEVECIQTPDTGQEDFTCVRCGYSPETIIYY
jgi:hypothetical protein